VQHGFDERTPMPDIDVIYYDPENIEESVEKKYEEVLRRLLSTIPWSVKNQARMHIVNNSSAYTSSVDAIGKFPETVTALAVKLDEKNKVILTAPHGIQDVINLIVKPTPYFLELKDRMLVYEKRVRNKSWKVKWSKIEVIGGFSDVDNNVRKLSR